MAVFYKIYDTFKNDQPIFECYIVAYLPLVVLVLLGSINPAWRGYESLVYFFIYIPMFALFIFLFTMTPVIIAHITYTKKSRNRPKQNNCANKQMENEEAALLFSIGLVSMFVFGAISIIGFLLTTGVCIYKITHFIKRKIKERREKE